MSGIVAEEEGNNCWEVGEKGVNSDRRVTPGIKDNHRKSSLYARYRITHKKVGQENMLHKVPTIDLMKSTFGDSKHIV